MLTILTVVHITVCVFMVIIVLLQHGKGADVGATFGGGSGQTMFGTEGPLPLLNKITTASAILFMVTSVALAYFSANLTKGSIMEDVVVPAPPPVEQQTEVPPKTIEVPLTRTNTEGENSNPADATFPGEASTAPVPVTEKEAAPAEESAAPAEQAAAPAKKPAAAEQEPAPAKETAAPTEEPAPAEQTK